MKKSAAPKSREAELVIQEIDGEILIYDLRNDKAFCLNSTLALVWKACDGSKSVAEIKDFVSKELNSKSNEDLIWLALDQLKKENLIENGNDILTPFAGMSRREVIRKVGVGSMIALPMIAGLVAPPVYAQASGCGNTCNCDESPVTAGEICMTGMGGMACVTPPVGCTVCRSTVTATGMTGVNPPGFCATS